MTNEMIQELIDGLTGKVFVEADALTRWGIKRNGGISVEPTELRAYLAGVFDDDEKRELRKICCHIIICQGTQDAVGVRYVYSGRELFEVQRWEHNTEAQTLVPVLTLIRDLND